MAEAQLILFIDLEQGSRIDLEAAAKAAIAWSKLIKSVGMRIDPMREFDVELDSSLPGSQKLKSIIKVPEGTDLRTLIMGAVGAAIFFLFKEAVSWGVAEVLDYINGPDAPQEISMLSEDERQSLAEDIASLLRDADGNQEVEDVYRALEEDQNVTGAGVTSSDNVRPKQVVPRGRFPHHAPIIEVDEDRKRTRVEMVELILVRPVLTADTNRRWGFDSAFGPFGAPIHDEDFLKSISKGIRKIPMIEGIRMTVDLEVTEEFSGGVWRPTNRTITKVRDVSAPPSQDDLELEPPQPE